MPLATVQFLELVGIFILLAWGIYSVYRIGQLDNAPIYTMAIGAYCSAFLARDMGWPFGLALVAAVGLGALAAFLPALALGRAPGFATAIATIALIFIAQTVIRNIPGLGGATGLFHIPPVEYLLIVEYVAVIVVGIFIHRLEHSRIGGAMGVTFVDRDVAASLGINAYKLSVFLQVFAGALGALAGVFYAFAVSVIRVSHFVFSLLLSVNAFLFVGGSRTM